MSTKSARNGRAVTTPRPAAAKAPADRQASAAERIAQLEADVAMLKEALDSAGRILASMVADQAVEASMPVIEGKIRGSIQQAYQQGGLAALVPSNPPAPQKPGQPAGRPKRPAARRPAVVGKQPKAG